MRVKIKIHRGLYANNYSVNCKDNKKEIEYAGSNLSDLMRALNIDEEEVGLIIINGRVATDTEKIEINPNDKVEFFPPLSGG